jgi:hypothetical protein
MTESKADGDAIRALIDEAFADYDRVPGALVLYRAVVDGVEFAVMIMKSRIGEVQCFYPLRPIAAELLLKYPPHVYGNIASTQLSLILSNIHIGLHIGMENVADAVDVQVTEMLEDVASVSKTNPKPPDANVANSRKKAALKQMDARNRLLVEAPQSGAQPEVSINRLSAAIGLLLGTGTEKNKITVATLANHLGCSDSAVYKTLGKGGKTLEQFLCRFPEKLDNQRG